MKKVIGVYGNEDAHWVGDGFPVRTLFFYQNMGKQMSPFLMLDFAGPAKFPPTHQQKGVGTHPHRGFETVTIVYEGEVSHKDSTGQGGTIGPGDVQWMTAGSGILHQEYHSEKFTNQGGTLQMIQLWVNLPAKYKMTSPAYQSILKEEIPVVRVDDLASVRVIAGEYRGFTGPAKTFTAMNVWDIHLKQGAELKLPAAMGWNASIVVLKGSVESNQVLAQEAKMLMFSPDDEGIEIKATEDAILLLLSGEPINEPIVGHGPFVMNTKEEIMQAIDDFNAGVFGQIH